MLAAADSASPDAAAALEKLCRTYWSPLYAFVRRCGHSVHDAEDLTQEFLAGLLHRKGLARLQPEKGRFRAFLLASLKHFLADQRDRESAQKRGGGVPVLSLDDTTAEARYQLEPRDDLTPDRVFERRWAYALLEQVLVLLRGEFVRAGKGPLFEALRPFLVGEAEGISYVEVAARLGLTEAAAKMTVTRMRRRYRELLRAEVAHTVADPREIDEELRHLMAALQ
ncbi:MAG: sigma-70 family RNA polymerase sigma factor [Verrucomicrobia bacterium]|nr:sigma-70 family RNA polymerase sigma factor [Verrucomicrobiota bacterium]